MSLARVTCSIVSVATLLLACVPVAAVAAAAADERTEHMKLLADAETAYGRGIELARTDPVAARAEFETAARLFQSLVDDGVRTAPLHYNLGNAYLKAGETGLAILNYRTAQRLDPGDAGIEHNLATARAQREGEIAPSGGRALARVLLGWHERTAVRSRFNVFLTAYLAFWALLTAGLRWGPHPALRWCVAAAAAIGVAAGVSVAASLWLDEGPPDGVLVADEVIVRKGNGEGFQPQFKEPLREGVELRVLEDRGGWYLIELPDGKTGWVPLETVGVVGR